MSALDKKSLLLEVFKNIELSDKKEQLLLNAFEEMNFNKGELLLSVGDPVTDQYYIASGCLRSFFMDDDGKEYTLMLGIKDWWISDYTGYFQEKPSILTIECLEDATVYKLSKVAQNELYTEIPQLETFFRKKMEGAFASFQKRILANISKPATDRYISFKNTYPNIETKVKNYHIASYLGITTESLSRIRKEIAKV